MTDKEKLFEILNKYTEELSFEKIQGSGSSRRYYKIISSDLCAIGVVGDDIDENKTFINLARYLREEGIRVPEVLRVSNDFSCYILENLGETSLFSVLGNKDKMALSKKVLKDLIAIQTLPREKWIDKVGYKPFSNRLVNWDLNYFKYDLLKPAGILFNEEKLEDDFEILTKKLLSIDQPIGLMYRDFQSRNIMIKEDDLWYIDFQGAREGPLCYDAVSFIWQAKAPFTFEERKELENFYIDSISSKLNINSSICRSSLKNMKIFRNLQVLGAYGFRGLIERKSHFIESIPKAVINLNHFKDEGIISDYPEIEKIANSLKEKFITPKEDNNHYLVVSIYSFSYKKGYPIDETGNGGGFMFDCRAIHNPGRYKEYKHLTGKDEEVIKFLETSSNAEDFIEKAKDIVLPSIEKYIERGFTSLQIGFGCTGGQHRSVYCAEKLAKKLSEIKKELKIKVIHKEQPMLNK